MGHNQSIFRTILHLKDTPFLAHDHDPRPMLLRNHYGVDMGTSGLVIQVQSRKEIFVDKLIAFALQPNRLKNRDLWDMGWLKHIGITLPLELLPKKLKDHRFHKENFLDVSNFSITRGKHSVRRPSGDSWLIFTNGVITPGNRPPRPWHLPQCHRHPDPGPYAAAPRR